MDKYTSSRTKMQHTNSSDDETLAGAPGNNYPVAAEKSEKQAVVAPNGMERSLDLNNLAEGKKASKLQQARGARVES